MRRRMVAASCDNRIGGDSVKVGPGPTRARWRLADADAVRRWLDLLASRGDAGTP